MTGATAMRHVLRKKTTGMARLSSSRKVSTTIATVALRLGGNATEEDTATVAYTEIPISSDMGHMEVVSSLTSSQRQIRSPAVRPVRPRLDPAS